MKAYPIIGGPLHGYTAKSSDFAVLRFKQVFVPGDGQRFSRYVDTNEVATPRGRFDDYRDLYVPFNRSGNTDMPNTKGRNTPSMVWIFKDWLV